MRLIDADDATRVVESVLEKYGLDRESVVTDEIHEAIDNINTVYDVEKVVEQLEHRRLKYEAAEANACNDSQKIYYSGIKRGYEYSKDIVRGGRE